MLSSGTLSSISAQRLRFRDLAFPFALYSELLVFGNYRPASGSRLCKYSVAVQKTRVFAGRFEGGVRTVATFGWFRAKWSVGSSGYRGEGDSE